ncbi:mannose-1-phosphate guanylyltransferase [Zavarzinia compransoris]|uniref:Mannose-1-phosphate guanylyltransferase/mannose-6-phosphate isomerase n=2 Tax=Zavarzinia compransoris TaxID=1264899 RepID=A0A317DTI9_9PROT|nr:sugar phosphate nucleotidyltransferase [Zavarzinia compransoris]PWR17981.1 mannose-1-phosphate guanylyltransferase/mannose-6-phosphate isomerase [Zavarzinia compransoris]
MQTMVPVILCGGSGTRFWPASTDEAPKQFLSIWQGLSLFQITAQRLAAAGSAAPLIICNRLHEAAVREQLAAIGIDGAVTLLEPERRDSAAAIAAAAAWVARSHGPGQVLGVFPSDQLIRDDAAFRQALAVATAAAAAGDLVTFGIRPDRPATEFGYIERGAPCADQAGAYHVASFHEKPKLETALAYLASGQFDWNSGMFVFAAGAFMAEAAVYMPGIQAAADEAVAGAQPGARPGTYLLEPAAFRRAEKNSIDYALFERSRKVVTVPLDCGWNDLGNWQAAHAELEKDGDGNVMQGDVRVLACRDSIVLTDGLPVRVLGVDGIAVIVSAKGVLVCKLDQAVRLKEVL